MFPSEAQAGTQIGLQLYTVMDALERDFEGTLRAVAKIGYKEVETMGTFGRNPEQATRSPLMLLTRSGKKLQGERFRSTPRPRLWACCAPWRAGRSLGGRRLRLEFVLRRARFVRSTCATFRLVEFAAASVHDNVGLAWGSRGGGIWLKWCKRL